MNKIMKEMEMYAMPLLVGACLVFFSCVVLYRWKSTHTIDSITINKDVQQLKEIFDRINKECTIVSFENDKNSIDFLNVKSFSGSQVGTMNLMYPDKWNGPYLKNNLSINTIDYQIIKTTKGFYIVPGDNVVLPNGKKIGTDILLDRKSDIESLIKNPALLADKNGNSFAAKINISSGTSQYISQDELADI